MSPYSFPPNLACENCLFFGFTGFIWVLSIQKSEGSYIIPADAMVGFYRSLIAHLYGGEIDSSSEKSGGFTNMSVVNVPVVPFTERCTGQFIS